MKQSCTYAKKQKQSRDGDKDTSKGKHYDRLSAIINFKHLHSAAEVTATTTATTATTIAPIIPTLLWSWLGEWLWSNSFMNQLARPDVRLKLTGICN